MRFALLSIVCGSLAFVSCDRHSWEDSAEIDPTTGEPLAKGTHRLFLEHGSHDDHASHDDHGSHGDHGKGHDGHGEKAHDDHGHGAKEHSHEAGH